MGVPLNIELDVGALWVAPLGTTEPTANAIAQASPLTGFRAVGYTLAGSKFLHTPTVVAIEVEEEYEPIRWATQKVEDTLEFNMNEPTRSNLALAMSAGANAVNDTTPFESPSPGTELRVMIMWESAIIGERWLFRQCMQVGPVMLDRRKAPNRTELPVKFQLEKPLNVRPFKCWPSPVGSVGQPGVLV